MSTTSKIGVRPVQARAKVTQERLLKAAVTSFARIGYEASSTRLIEANAGVKRGLIAYHFGSKEKLWKAATSWILDLGSDSVSEIEQSAEDLDPVERMRHFGRSYVRDTASRPEINRLMIREGIDNDWRLKWLVKNAVRPWYQKLRQMFEEAQQLGIAPAMEFPHFYYILTGAGSLLFSMAAEAEQVAGIDTQDEAVISAHANALADVLFPRAS